MTKGSVRGRRGRDPKSMGRMPFVVGFFAREVDNERYEK